MEKFEVKKNKTGNDIKLALEKQGIDIRDEMSFSDLAKYSSEELKAIYKLECFQPETLHRIQGELLSRKDFNLSEDFILRGSVSHKLPK